MICCCGIVVAQRLIHEAPSHFASRLSEEHFLEAAYEPMEVRAASEGLSRVPGERVMRKVLSAEERVSVEKSVRYRGLQADKLPNNFPFATLRVCVWTQAAGRPSRWQNGGPTGVVPCRASVERRFDHTGRQRRFTARPQVGKEG